MSEKRKNTLWLWDVQKRYEEELGYNFEMNLEDILKKMENDPKFYDEVREFTSELFADYDRWKSDDWEIDNPIIVNPLLEEYAWNKFAVEKEIIDTTDSIDIKIQKQKIDILKFEKLNLWKQIEKYQSEINKLKSKIDDLEWKNSYLTIKNSRFDKENEIIMDRLNEKNAKLSSAINENVQFKKDIENRTEQIIDLYEKNKERIELKKQINKLVIENDELKDKIGVLEKESKIPKNQFEFNKDQSEINSLKNELAQEKKKSHENDEKHRNLITAFKQIKKENDSLKQKNNEFKEQIEDAEYTEELKEHGIYT